MADVKITIVAKAGGKIEPESGIRQKVSAGQTVTFVPGGDLQAVKVRFRGPSPFEALTPKTPGGKTDEVPYGTVGTVKALPQSAANIFAYDCVVKTADGREAVSPGGGEIEIIRG